MSTGLLLGAGASFESGFPLVWELTHNLRTIVTPQILRERNARSHQSGLGIPDHLVDYLIALISNMDMHYENIIGNLQMMYRRAGGHGDGRQYHRLAADLTEIVYWLLYDRQKRLEPILKPQLRLIDGIVGLMNTNSPLWVFSLNHDLLIECLAAQYDIPISHGFSGEMILPLPLNEKGVQSLKGQILTKEQIETKALEFLSPGQRGINLFKLHGSLDIFKYRNQENYIKILPTTPSVEGVLQSSFLTNEILPYKDPRAPDIRMTNEIMYLDQDGEVQYLGRSLLTGAYKFPEPRSLRLRNHDLLSHFLFNMNYISKLIVIGYGFGDIHVNHTIREWLDITTERTLEIVDPQRTAVPGEFLHLAPQVKLHKLGTFDFLRDFSPRPFSFAEKISQSMFQKIRSAAVQAQEEAVRRVYNPKR